MNNIDIEIDEPAIEIDETSQQSEYVLPTATASRLGGIKVGANLTVESDGTLNAVQGSYTLLQATNNVLGGVYVDTTLSSSSENPVQNKVINNSLNNLSNNLSTLESSISNLSSNISSLSQSVTDLGTSLAATDATIEEVQGDVSTNTDNISTNTSNISSLQSSVSTLNTNVGTIQGNITTMNQSLLQVQSLVTSLSTVTNISVGYGDIDPSVWTGGNIKAMGVGVEGYLQVNLSGNLNLAASGSFTIYNIQDILIKYDMLNVVFTDAGVAVLAVQTNGNIVIMNPTSSAMSIHTITGIVPFIINLNS